MDVSKLRPKGPWVVVKVDPPPEMEGSLYLPQGNLAERMGNATGTVLKVGEGFYTTDKVRNKTGRKYEPIDLKEGDRIMFRGFLQEANQVGGVLDREHCLLNAADIIGVIEEE